ncbi:carbohydrate-binding protein [Nonomuraea typhae]|uniref:carbohydrate-binding protein n=1 Tax=Nonomuraea typhae TaxID=2603600 RepID=UPI0012FA319C|nr:carbohydrate-binding protein [Nonomuraea typhae]
MLRKHVVGMSVALSLTLATIPVVAYAASNGANQAPNPYAQAKELAAAVANPDPKVIAGLERDLGLTTDQAIARLVNEAAAAQVEADYSARLGSAFGGLWVTGPTAELVLATTQVSGFAKISELGAKPVLVNHSLNDLNAVTAQFDRQARRMPAGVHAWFADIRANKVVLQAKNVVATQKFVDASGVNTALVEVQKSVEQPRPFHDVRGGDAYYIGSGSRCSVGFSVNRSGSQGGFVTAGHCGTTGATTSGFNRVAQGTFRGSSFPGNDYAWVEVNTQWTPVGVVNAYNQGIINVTGSQQGAVGASICRSGSTTQYRCGTISQHNTSVTYPQGTVSGVTRTTVCAEPGDSGGSYISGNQAQGVTSGGSGNCSSGGTTFHQPVNEILQTYQLTLAGGGGPTSSPTSTPTGTPPGGTWAPGVAYAVGATVTYDGASYRCLQAHTSQPGWTPPAVPALWQRI